MGIFIDLTGQRFNRWTVVSFAGLRKGVAYWRCICDCGNTSEILSNNLRRGVSKSCGCLAKEVWKSQDHRRNVKHELSYHKYFNTWYGMVKRCCDPRNKQFKDYGGRGITICDEWKNGPEKFLGWCDNQIIPKGHTLDRIDNNGNYCPENCHFASHPHQRRNSRNIITIEYNGETLCLRDFVDKYSDVPYSTITDRINKQGMTPIEAAFTPSLKR